MIKARPKLAAGDRIKIGFDLHGVINEKPEFFAKLSRALVKAGHEVHIITGNPRTKAFKAELAAYNFHYTHFFSITEFHKKKGTKIRWIKDHPFMDDREWDKTKGEYCRRRKIDMHIDDTDAYRYFFSTPFCRYYSMNKRKSYKPEDILSNEDREFLEWARNNPQVKQLQQLQVMRKPKGKNV